MPRKVDHTVHQVRRDAFLDVAQRLITTKGYEAMSIQDVLDELDTSRGALYHYFDSKAALLDGVVERFADAAMAALRPILEDSSGTALDKLVRVFAEISAIKAGQMDLVLAVVEVWKSDANALVREKLRRLSATRLEPILSAVVRQGIAEGTIHATGPDETARVLVYLLQGYQEHVSEQFLGRRSGAVSFEEVRRGYAAFQEAFERILGVPAGSVEMLDDATLRFWFGEQPREAMA